MAVDIPVDERIAALAASNVYQDLDAGSLARLDAAMRLIALRPRQHLWHEGDTAHSLYVLVRGHVRVYRCDASGNEVVLNVYGPGNSFGEPGLWAPHAERVANASAVARAVCLAIHERVLRDWMEEHPCIAIRQLESLAGLTQQHARIMMEATSLAIAARVAVRLLELAEEFGAECEDGVRIDLPLTQRMLAGMVAASRENVNRALTRFRALGAISLDDGSIVLRDPEVLQELSEEPRWKPRVE